LTVAWNFGPTDIGAMERTRILQERLLGGLWHTTRPDRFASILATGCVSATPDIPDSERWKASRPEHCPFVRCLGGVSLFDFDGFDPEAYAKTHPMSNWYDFVPHLRKWGGAVWVEIDRDAVAGAIISKDELVVRWDRDGNWGHAIMPRIEAAHIGDVSRSAFRSAFLTWADGHEVRELDVQQLSRESFAPYLAEWLSSR
jgi:hypothetical protein